MISTIYNHSGLIKLLGWTGSIAYILGYILLTFKILKVEKALYHILNIIGAIGLIFDAVYLKDYPNVIVNIIWMLIATIGIVKNKRSNNDT